MLERENFLMAIENGDTKKFNSLMNKEDLFDYGQYSYPSRMTYLHYAAEMRQADIIRTMFSNKKHGAKIDPNIVSQYDWNGFARDVTPLIIAISKSDIGCIQALVENGADINYSHQDSFSPFTYAKHIGNPSIVQYFFNTKKRTVKLSSQDIRMLSKTSDGVEEIIRFYGDTQIIKKQIASALAKPLNSDKPNTRSGYISVDTSKPKIRKYQSFSDKRERQILRHVATQIYFMLKDSGVKDLIEIQILHLQCNGSSNLFIVGNDVSATKNFKDYIKRETFEKKLNTTYSPKRVESKERTNRYAYKLKERIFGKKLKLKGKKKDDLVKANFIRNILREKNMVHLNADYSNSATALHDISDDNSKSLSKYFESEENNIFALHIMNCSDLKRHAEEFLCDIVEYAKVIYDYSNVHSCIAGKKRPCIGCSGRMKNTGISNYGKFPGLFFKDTIKTQAIDVAASTAEILKGETYLSLCKNGFDTTSGFDTGSDSEKDSDSNDSPDNYRHRRVKK